MRRDYSSSVNIENRKNKVVGEVRQSQLITSFGCGSIIDFLDRTVMIAGIDKWDWAEQYPDNPYIIHNENLQNMLGVDYFVKPKVDEKKRHYFAYKSEDIPAFVFPEVLYCTNCKRLFRHSEYSNQLFNKSSLKCIACHKNNIIASSFVAVCDIGHIEDFPYSLWVHRGNECAKSEFPRLRLFNVGGKSGISNLLVKCDECGEKRGMQGAFMENALVNIKRCESNSPWLHGSRKDECIGVLRTRTRTSINVHFPVTVSALSIPPWSSKIFNVLERYYEVLKIVTDSDQVRNIITQLICPLLPNMSIDEIVTALDELKKSKEGRKRKTAKQIHQDEYKTFIKVVDKSDEYSAQTVEAPGKYSRLIKRVVAAHKLTEVVALKGFVRLSAWSGDISDERIAPLSSSPKNWLPAVKMNGEGIFIEFDCEQLSDWEQSTDNYYEPMRSNLDDSYLSNDRFSAQYVFLHTFAHLLIRQLSLECGYSAASIKERIYSTYNEDNYQISGILIYTASSDADGSLGGLVEQSAPEKLERLIDSLIEEARWCSSDPLCITSFSAGGQGFSSLNYAACHSCVLLPETSCEFRNLLLDRGAVVGTPNCPELGLINYLGIEV